MGKIFDSEGEGRFKVLIDSSDYNTLSEDWSIYSLNEDDKFVISFIAEKTEMNNFLNYVTIFNAEGVVDLVAK